MKIKTSALTGVALDWAAATAKGEDHTNIHGHLVAELIPRYSTDWAQGGPLKETHAIATRKAAGKWYAIHSADLGDGERAPWCKFTFRNVPRGASTSRQCLFEAPTELIAALRCIVAYVLGNEVEIPDELTPANNDN